MVKQTIIFIHGLFSSAELHRVLPLVNSMKNAGFNVLVPELVGHGKDTGDRADAFNLRESMDVIAILMRKQKGKVVLVGHSIGGAIALSLGVNLRSHVKAVFAIAAPNGRYTARREHLKKLSMLFNYDINGLDSDRYAQIIQVMPIVNFKHQKRIPKIFLIHAKSDAVVPFKEFEENKKIFNVKDERTVVYDHISNIGEWDHGLCAYHPRTLKFINQNVKELSKT
jgi:pimeloyl-ACP methyl ester carboxylesterase